MGRVATAPSRGDSQCRRSDLHGEGAVFGTLIPAEARTGHRGTSSIGFRAECYITGVECRVAGGAKAGEHDYRKEREKLNHIGGDVDGGLDPVKMKRNKANGVVFRDLTKA